MVNRAALGLRFRRFEVSTRYDCNVCGAPGQRFMFHYDSRWFTGNVWCAACWDRVQATLRDAGLLGRTNAQ